MYAYIHTYVHTQVATISANGEREIGDMLAKAMDRVTKDGERERE
jgi:chaperonin GroEL (HSP60 family)